MAGVVCTFKDKSRAVQEGGKQRVSNWMSPRTMMCESPRVLFCMVPPPFLNLPLIYSVHISMKSSSQKSDELSVLTLGDSVFFIPSGWLTLGMSSGCWSFSVILSRNLAKPRRGDIKYWVPRSQPQFPRNQSAETLLWVPGTGRNRLGIREKRDGIGINPEERWIQNPQDPRI